MQEISSINLWYLQAIDTFERTLNTDFLKLSKCVFERKIKNSLWRNGQQKTLLL
jgi:hypothetical protein